MDFVASARRLCPLGPLRTRAGSTVRYAMQGIAERGAGEEERRRDEGAGERAKEVAREEARRRERGKRRRRSLRLLVVRQQELG